MPVNSSEYDGYLHRVRESLFLEVQFSAPHFYTTQPKS